MTTKLLNGAHTGGYTLSAAYTGVVVNYGATVTGYNPIFSGSGGVGLTLTFAASLTNIGAITGGRGTDAQFLIKADVAAGAGGAGVEVAPGSTVNNVLGVITGGQGGAGDTKSGGAAGGAGVLAGAGSNVIDTLGIIVGGAGGSALAASALDGGAGGLGVDLAAGEFSMDGTIAGGAQGRPAGIPERQGRRRRHG